MVCEHTIYSACSGQVQTSLVASVQKHTICILGKLSVTYGSRNVMFTARNLWIIGLAKALGWLPIHNE